MACEEEGECIGCNLNPKVKVKFEAKGTRLHIDSLLNLINEKIASFTDSLETDITAEQRNQILEVLASDRADSTKYQQASTLFRSGKTKIDFMTAQGAQNLDQFQDTIIREFALPVDMQHDTSSFYFTYHDMVDTLQLYYHREIKQTLDGVRMKLTNIGVNDELSTFDSTRVKCYRRDCANDLTTIFVYF